MAAIAHEQERVIFTNMCMVTDGDRVLVEDRVDPGWSGVTFPGGHVEPNESFTAAVIREVAEETGLTITAPRLVGIKDWMREDGSRYVVLCYRAERFSGELRSSEEGRVFWTRLDELPHLQLTDDMLPTLRLFGEEKISEMFYYQKNGDWALILQGADQSEEDSTI